MQAAEPLDQLVAGREEQVERVAEHHVEAELGGLAHLERLDHALGGERDERGRAHLAVGQRQRAGAGVARGVAGADSEGHGAARVAAGACRIAAVSISWEAEKRELARDVIVSLYDEGLFGTGCAIVPRAGN